MLTHSSRSPAARFTANGVGSFTRDRIRSRSWSERQGERGHDVGLLLGRVLAGIGLIACSGLVYHVTFSSRYHVRDVHTSGNVLVSATEVERIVAEASTEAFWIQSGEIRKRIMQIPAVADASVRVVLPDRLEVRVRERMPFAALQSGADVFLLDSDGVTIGKVNESPQILTIRHLDAPADPPARFDPESFEVIKVLSRHLSGTAFEPTTFAYSKQSGLELQTREGVVVRLGDTKDLDWKLVALDKMRQHLVENRLSAQLLDVRFRDRPYVR